MNKYSGLYTTVISSEKCEPLTFEKMGEIYKQVVDLGNKYHLSEKKRILMETESRKLIEKALDKKIITPEKYWKLYMSISFNGFLLVSREMFYKLNKNK